MTVVGLPADRARALRHRRIYALDLRGLGDRAAALVARRGDRDSAARLPPARGTGRGGRRSHADVYDTRFYRRLRGLDRLVRGSAPPGAGGDAGPVRGRAGRVCAGAAAVLPELGPAGTAGRPAAAGGRIVRGDAARGAALRSHARAPAGDRSLTSTSSAPGAPRFYLPLDQQLAGAELRAVRDHGAKRAAIANRWRGRSRRHPARGVRAAAHAHHAPGERAAGGIPGAVPRHAARRSPPCRRWPARSRA